MNYAEARSCAWRERLAQQAGFSQNQQEPTAWVVGGSLILADIYFNGAGVDRNVSLAMRFACEAEPELAQLALRDIAKPDHSVRGRGPFEFCDYAATTFTMNFCSGYESEIADDRRSRYYKSLKASMSPQQQAAFQKLLDAEDAYVDAHAAEVYQGGTIRTIRTLGSESILRNLFHSEVVHFEQKKWPVLSRDRTARADALLQDEYQTKLKQLGAHTKDEIADGEVTASDLSRVERVWKGYREAWVTFARVRHPGTAAAVCAEITLERYRLLKTIE